MMNLSSRRGTLHPSYRTFATASFVLVLLALGLPATTTVSLSARADRARVADPGRRSNQRMSVRGPAAAPRDTVLTSTMFLPPPPSVTVDRTDDAVAASACTAVANDCSLRGAVAFADLNPGTTINVPAGTYQLNIPGGAGEGFSGDNSIGDLDVTGNNTTISGAGAATTIIQQTQPNDRVLEVNPFLDASFNFTISGVTITGGSETTAVGGGGIISGSIDNATFVTNCIVSNNSATGVGTFGGGGISNGGGSLTISGTTFTGNSTTGSGGGVGYSAGDPLGRFPSSGTLNMSGSTFSSNTANSSAAGGGAADLFDYNLSTSSYNINSSSFSANNAPNGSGGAIIVESGPLTVTTSSFASNHAAFAGGAIDSSGSVSVTFSRLVGNTVPVAPNGLTLFRAGGSFTAEDNWWGSNAGPAGNDFRTPTGSLAPATFLQLRESATPSTICAGATSNLIADIKQRNIGAPLTTELNGLPAFPVPPATIFNNAVLGTISAASTQFVNGAATATFTAGGTTGIGSADATADNQTVTATLTINQNTTSALSNQTVCEGGTATFTTTASGSGPITFIWKKGVTVLNNGDLGGRVTITSGANTSTLSISNVQPGDADTYTVEATGSCSTATRSATLTVNASTSATTPTDQTVCQGITASFSTTASGTGPFTYQWKLDGGNIAGATSSTVNIATGSLSVGSHTVDVVVGGTCGTVTKSASLTVQANTSATTPTDQTVCQGITANFSTTASGTGPFTYQWKLDGSNIAGATSSSVNIATGSLSVSHTVDVVVGGTCGTVTKSASLTVQANTSATTPTDQTVCQGIAASFSTTASGTGPFTYQWKLDGSNVAGATSSSVNIATGSLSVGSHTVDVVVGGTCGTVTKSAALTVQANTTTTKPNDQSLCQGATASFSTTASGTGPFTFVWKKGVVVLHTGDFGGRVTITSSSTTSSLTITNSQSGDAGSYSVETTGTCGTAAQNATLAINSAGPTITMDTGQHNWWPPNHSYQTIHVTDFVLSAQDACDPNVNRNSVYIWKITSDEAENGPGSGNTLNDIVIAPDCKSAQMRAEREGGGDGRVYTIYFKVKNAVGNFSTATAQVFVPKSQNGDGAVDSGPHYTVTSSCP